MEEERTELLLSHVALVTDQYVNNIWTMLLHTTSANIANLLNKQYFRKIMLSIPFLFVIMFTTIMP